MHTRTVRDLSSTASARHVRWLARRELLEASNYIRSTPDGVRLRATKPFVDAGVWAFGVAARLLGFWGRGLANALQVKVRAVELAFADLPAAFDGYTLLHVTDPHFDLHPALAAAILAAAADQQVDLLVLTGDYVADETGSPSAAVMTPMAHLCAQVSARDGVVATLGNHDTAAMVPAMEAVGIRVLVNDCMAIERGDEALVLTGTDDVHRYWSEDATRAIQAFAPAPGRFGIALVHSPELAPEAAAAGHRLYLCGHTHGGQISLPGGIPVLTHDQRRHGQVPRRLARGRWSHGAMTGITSTGAGASGIPLRFATPPEMLRITLRRG